MDATEKITSAQQLFEYVGEGINLWSMIDEGIAGSQAYTRAVDLLKPCNKGVYDTDLPDEFYIDARKKDEEVLAYLAGRELGYYDTAIFRARIMNAEVINNDNYWVFREMYRAAMRAYKIPSFVKTLHDMGVVRPAYDLHFPHTSLEDPTMVAYTPSYEYGIRDRQVRIKVGKYLQKYYGEVLSTEQIRALANEAKGYEVQWAKTVEGMREVYRLGPSSCMSGDWSDEGVDGDVTPIDVYVGEFSLGYFKNSVGKYLARGLVHEPTKTWVRTYGDEGTALAEAFDALGYTHVRSWEGAHLTVVEDDDGRTLLPYLDGDAKGVRYADGKWEICASGSDYEHWCDFTDGIANRPAFTCDCCGREYRDADDSRYSEYANQTFGPCCEDEFTWAIVGRHGDRDHVPNDYVVYNNSDQEYYSLEYAERLNLICDYKGNYWDSEDIVQLMDGEYAHTDDAVLVGEDKYGDTQYIGYDHWFDHREFMIRVNPDHQFRYTLWYKELITDEMQDEIDEQKYITTDYGVAMPEKWMTIRELVSVYGADEAARILANIGLYLYKAQRITEEVAAEDKLAIAA